LPMLKTITTDISIADLFEGDLQLTSPPNLFFELKRVLENPNKSLADAGDIIINDPALTMRLLKLVNSAYFGFSDRIIKVSVAISMIGARELQNFVLATLIINKFSAQPDGMMTMHEFWAASVRSALMARALALALPNQIKEGRESVFICGLLHDIGKLVFCRRIPEIARQVGLLAEQSSESEAEIEQRILGFDHYDAGAELARLWHLPAIISETIGQHCKPDTGSPHHLVADLVRTANLASKLALPEMAFSLDRWGLSNDALCGIIDDVHDQFDEVFSIFYPVK
jgi:putative nucleotidyltransferase with HDIG domain